MDSSVVRDVARSAFTMQSGRLCVLSPGRGWGVSPGSWPVRGGELAHEEWLLKPRHGCHEPS